VVVSSVQVSKHHARAFVYGGRIYIEDLNSTNGTRVNGHPVAKSVLLATDMVTLGASVRLDVAELRRRLGMAEMPQYGGTATDAAHAGTRVQTQPPDSGVTIGRAFDNQIVVNNPQVSRHHAVLEKEGRTWVIRDLGSANGTYVNGRRVRRQVLSPHDEVCVADCDVGRRLQDILGSAAPRVRARQFRAGRIPAWRWGVAAAASVLLICGVTLTAPLARQRYQEYSDFMVAQQANTEEAYKQFVAAHPHGSYAAKARHEYEKLRQDAAQAAFFEAQQGNTIEAWDRVAQQYQDVQQIANNAWAQKALLQTQLEARQNQERLIEEMQKRDAQYQQIIADNETQLREMQRRYQALDESRQLERQRLAMDMENMRVQNANQARALADQRAIAERNLAIAQQAQDTASTAQGFQNAIGTANCIMDTLGKLQILSLNAP
jgi:pSer/pThr/pTyr-binding forkhead associated (FHA) protein